MLKARTMGGQLLLWRALGRPCIVVAIERGNAFALLASNKHAAHEMEAAEERRSTERNRMLTHSSNSTFLLQEDRHIIR